MKTLTRIGLLALVGIFALSAVPALALDCPNTHKTVSAYYEKTAKKQGVDQAKLAQAKTLLDQADQDHKDGKHKVSMDKMADAMKLITAATP
ncbi:MAG: hypothetical protein ACREOH_23065 [Candidatus Entotheonellia bacterium]|jgi:hypothetical protein